MKKLLLVVPFLTIGLLGASCAAGTPGTQSTEAQKQEDIQKQLVESVPVPEVTNSTTRQALSDRTELFNANDKVMYVYLVSFGKVMAFYTIKGQVVSLRSYLTPMENIVDYKGTNCTSSDNCYGSSSYADQGYIVSAPDVDGTYGDNPDGIFFFTTDGAYIEWRGDYMVSDQPLQLATPPELVRVVE